MNEKSKNKNVSKDRVYETHPAFEEDRRRDGLRQLKRPFRRRALLIQLVLFGVVLVLWRIPIVNPVKLLVVLFHELSHVFAAYVTGAVVFGIAIDPGGAGVTLGMGGDELLIVAAGYVGSLLIGIVLYALSAIWEPDDVWGGLCILCCVSLVFGWLNDFTAVFAYGTIFLMLLGFFVLSGGAKMFFLRLVATASCLYPIIDVAGEFYQSQQRGFRIQGEVVGSDISQLAGLTGVPESFLALVWIAAGLLAVILLMSWASKKDAEMKVKRSLFRPRFRMKFEHPSYDPNDPNNVPEYVIR